jgi:GNAT superfamily N-acetyltransferase
MVDRIEPLTPENWAALEKLFGKQGAVMGCWCMYWRLPRKDWEKARGARAKALFKRRVMEGPPPGVLAFDGDDAVGWLQIGPRADAAQWNGARRVSAPIAASDAADPRLWSANCFFVAKSARGKGVGVALLEGAIAFARKSGARAIEACPIDGDASAGAAYVGRTVLFERAGFKEVARRKANRPLMRLRLRSGRARRLGKTADSA